MFLLDMRDRQMIVLITALGLRIQSAAGFTAAGSPPRFKIKFITAIFSRDYLASHYIMIEPKR